MGRRTPEELTRLRERYEHRKLNGLCIDCGATLQDSDEGLSCVEHQAIRNASAARQRRKPRAKELHKAAKLRWRAEGRCNDCGAPADGKMRCRYHLDLSAERTRKFRKRKKFGITAFKRKPTVSVDFGREEIARYQPLDEIEQKPRVRILLALSWFEWVTSLEIWEALGIDMSDGSIEHNTYAQSLSRLCRKYGCVEKRGERGMYRYRITEDGRAEAAAIRNGEVESRTRRAA